MNKKYPLYIAEREKGKTYQEIADQFGVSRQCVHKACTTEHSTRRKPNTNLSCAYPVLMQWLFDNNYSFAALHREVQRRGSKGCYRSFCLCLNGHSRISLPIATVIAEITGIPIQTLFRT